MLRTVAFVAGSLRACERTSTLRHVQLTAIRCDSALVGPAKYPLGSCWLSIAGAASGLL